MKHLPYPGWVSMRLKEVPRSEHQAERAFYFSEEGKAKSYDYYAEYCKIHKFRYDFPPELYAEYKHREWHSLALIGTAILGGFAYFLSGLISGTKKS